MGMSVTTEVPPLGLGRPLGSRNILCSLSNTLQPVLTACDLVSGLSATLCKRLLPSTPAACHALGYRGRHFNTVLLQHRSCGLQERHAVAAAALANTYYCTSRACPA